MLFSKEDHPKYPPSSWTVRKHGRKWGLFAGSCDYPLGTFLTKREAEQAKLSGFLVALYEKEGRWFAGERIQGWKLYSECVTA